MVQLYTRVPITGSNEYNVPTHDFHKDVEFKQDCISWPHLDSNTSLIPIETKRDELWEGDESFIVKLFNVEGATLSPKYSQAVGIIAENNRMFPSVSHQK